MLKLVTEALVVGVSVAVMGLLVHILYHSKHAHSDKIKQDTIDLIIILFFTGVFLHLLFEVTGINMWYCKNGNASSNVVSKI